MKVLLVTDSLISNLALMKLSTFYKNKGDQVSFNEPNPDLILISKVFTYTKLPDLSKFNCEKIYGGSGYDLITKLDIDIENSYPDYNLYPKNRYSIGFTSRGCIRKCSFCIVPKKEGNIYINSNMFPEKWVNPEYNKVMLLDNNWYANKENFMITSKWFIDNRKELNVTQGYDIRLLDYDIAIRLKKINHYKPIHFAFDSFSYYNELLKGVKILKELKFSLRSKIIFYVYCDSDNDFDDALERVMIIKEINSIPLLMINHENNISSRMKRLYRYCNFRNFYRYKTFYDYQKLTYKNVI